MNTLGATRFASVQSAFQQRSARLFRNRIDDDDDDTLSGVRLIDKLIAWVTEAILFTATNDRRGTCRFGIKGRFCTVERREITMKQGFHRVFVFPQRHRMGLTPCA